MSVKKVMVIGLDCAEPRLVFEQWKDELPYLRSLMEKGGHGRLKSTIPPITVPAWMSMMTGKSPGVLGFYGFRNRKNYDYGDLEYATALKLKDKTVWDYLSETNKKSIILNVPQTYPPKPLNGHLISCFLTPDAASQYSYPATLKDEVQKLVGEYIFDVKNFRSEDKNYILNQIYSMAEQHFVVARTFLERKEWEFFMMVDMGVDRIHHAFWKYCDETHPKHPPGNPYKNAIRDYYKYVDTQIGSLLRYVDSETAVFVVSDHGAQKMDGGICLNEWLIKEGYLKLLKEPDGIKSPEKIGIDWSRTKVWGEGGYYGRVFLNVKGREPQGIIEPSQYEAIREEIIDKLENLPDEFGNSIGTKVFRPEAVYKELRGIPPDLIVYFGNLAWRSVGSVGHKTIWTHENDTGPDDANHAQYGMIIVNHPAIAPNTKLPDLDIRDIAPTLLKLYGLQDPGDIEGTSFL